MFGRLLSPHETAVFLGIPTSQVDVSMAGEKIPGADDAVWKLMFGLFDSPWFRRLWIVQEFILARDVTFFHGTSTLDWRHLFASVLYYADTLDMQLMALWAAPDLQGHAGLGLFFTMAYQRDFRQLQATPAGRAFLDGLVLLPEIKRMRSARWFDLLQWYRPCGCTLERDRYYALLGLASDADDFAGHPELTPDYTTGDAALNLRVGKFLITRRGSDGCAVFMRAGLSTQKDVSAPSWMQSFAQFRPGQGGDKLFEHAALNSDQMAAGGYSEFAVALAPEFGDDVIRLEGYKVDDVLGVSKQISPLTAEQANMSLDERLCDHVCGAFQMFSSRIEASHVAPAVIVDQGCLEIMVETLTAGKWNPIHTQDRNVLVLGLFLILVRHEDQFDGFRDWKAVLAGVLQTAYGYPRNLFDAEGRVAVSDEVRKNAVKSFLIYAYKPYRAGLNAAITREGHFANVPDVSDPGDEIWIISGCNLPIVLRRSNQREGMFRLVGVCYAHGVMDGSVLLRKGFAFQEVLLY